ncbi:double-strand break repair helicase AddA [Maritimibacter dapengensis]|uniref:DNA 3'-5' helicase n=1 Tax=Maritimibacter dapengensis TaxID=2836868 RepID=A0ABS6T472_9RHOB|nr:double-strand break repair helicase AddA [Maritimibacter dapengensis]MBV7380044.1 double-strand break repair helicase AddA [Maritimibacter dapengensis]
MKFDDATQAQIDAADPDTNTWLSANAGSGKTKVLTDRVARLLLSGVVPQNVLCLTYTKAAASEMQNRLFKRLGEWAMLEDTRLRTQLAALGVSGEPDLKEARRLFARAVETPGGLKIQTIHAFCASILRRFPMEAGVSPDFQEMDERSGVLLRNEVVEEMALGGDRERVEAFLRHFTGAELDASLAEVSSNRLAFVDEVSYETVAGWFGLGPRDTQAELIAGVFTSDVKTLFERAVPILSGLSSTMQSQAALLAEIDLDEPGISDLQLLFDAVLIKSGTPKKTLLTKDAIAKMGDDAERYRDLAEDAADAFDRLKTLGAAERTLALHRFARRFVQLVESRKAERGWLDFDDLIQFTARLLTHSDLAQWVLFRLDGGIDHILVDESQDTSPAQWQVIARLAEEFMSGEGSHAGRTWSLFVVGDPKQSIYSFQGADPAEFLRMRDWFREKLLAVQSPLKELPLKHSFRSSPAILSLVDTALEATPGLGDAKPDHLAFFGDKAGRVDLWPFLEKTEEPEAKPWHEPVDEAAPTDHNVVLAKAVADEISRMLEFEQVPKEIGFAPVTPGDIIVLVQRRSELFHHIIRACKSRGIAVAGADRLKIGGELAVKDLTALLNVLATPEDDLSLAAVLRSPLIGWSENELYRLARGRKRYLFRALRDAGPSAALNMLSDLRDNADYLRPYDLIDRVLTRHDGRRLLTGRLGAEAEDGIDALLAQALAYERMEVPSLTGFLTWLAADDVEIKRQMDTDAKEVRVMTVHGSKGLEAPVVILPDTAKRDIRGRGEIFDFDGHAVWKPKADETPQILLPGLDAAKDREREERARLLYVAMTRAESWLIVAGAGDNGKEAEDSWHGIIGSGFGKLEPEATETPLGTGQRYSRGSWPAPERHDIVADADLVTALPDWLELPEQGRAKQPKPLIPSQLGGDKVITGAGATLDGDAAMRRGRQLHRLLEFLPSYPTSEWDHHASALLAFGEDAAREDELEDLILEARSVLEAEHLSHLFEDRTLAEVGISAPVDIAGHTRMHGVIDRLVIESDRVIAIDFKSNPNVPERAEDIPEGILRQLGAYEVALAALYPDHEIVSAVLWTKTATLMQVPEGLALRAFGRLDADDVAT